MLQIELRLLVWTSSTGWAEASQKWAETPFSQLDMPVLEDSIAAFSKKLLRLEQGLPTNQVRKPQGHPLWVMHNHGRIILSPKMHHRLAISRSVSSDIECDSSTQRPTSLWICVTGWNNCPNRIG